jgi:ketosteroid isomerase-like protein
MSDVHLSARLDALESHQAIETLIYTYAQAFDRRDPVLLEGIWATDACLLMGDPFGNHEGIDAIRAFAKASWDQIPHMHHWMANPLITVDGVAASASTALDCFVTDRDSGPTQIGGVYHDRFEKRPEGWRLTERRFELNFLARIENWAAVAGNEAD